MTSPAQALATALSRDLPSGTRSLGVAVSGGSDSLALMLLLADWARAHGVAVRVATVDHGLRAEAATEAALVARNAAAAGLSQDVLVWRGWTGQGNLQACARAARLALLADWGRAQGLVHICLGHTLDDQAETVLLRLARGSGVDGLAGMAPLRRDGTGDGDGPVWLRPLLAVRRADLQALLQARGVGWADDPGNTNPRFDRIKARQALADGRLAGLQAPRLSDTADRMRAARAVLQQVAQDAARACLLVDHGAIGFELDIFAALQDDTRWRLLAHAIRKVAGQVYRPRLKALQRAETAARAGHRQALAGCILSRRKGVLWVDREPAALSGFRAKVPGQWDRRWDVTGPARPGLHMAALGPEGLAQCRGWRTAGLRRTPLLTTPGVWNGVRLVAAPSLPQTVADATDWRCRPLWDKNSICADLSSD